MPHNINDYLILNEKIAVKNQQFSKSKLLLRIKKKDTIDYCFKYKLIKL